jgi:hypothetical protein
MASELHRQITGEAIRTFRGDAANTIAGDPLRDAATFIRSLRRLSTIIAPRTAS